MRKLLKIILWTIGSILVLLVGIIVCLDTQWCQNFLRGKSEAYLRNKLKTEVHIGHFGLAFPKFIELDNVLFKDQAQDTLLAVGELKIDLNMLRLIHKEVDVQEIILTGVHSHIYRNRPDTTFNFTYIITAFTSGKTSKAKDTTTRSSSLNIDLDRVKFDDIHIRFDDYTGGMRLAVNLDHLDLKMKKLDLDKMLFHIKDLSVSGLQTAFSQDSSYLPPKPPDTAKTKLQLVADNADLERIDFKYNDALNKIAFALKLGNAQIQLNKFGLEDNVIDVKKLVMSNTDIGLEMGALSTAPSFVDTLVKIDTTTGWHITARDVDIAGVNFKMDDNSSPRQSSGIDYSHLYFQNTELNLRDFLYTSDTISGNVQHFTGREQCGLNVTELRTVFNYDAHGAALQNLYLKTPNTILQDHIEVHYPSVTALQKNMQLLQLNINVKNSVVGLEDVLVFVPQLRSEDIFRKYKNGRFNIEAVMTGTLNNLDIAHFYAAGMSNTEILLNGRVGGLPEVKELNYNLHISKFQSSEKDIAAMVPDTLLSSVRLPDKFGLTGQVSGTAKDYKTDLYFASTDGIAYMKGTLFTSPGKNKEHYDIVLRTSQLNIGRILKQDSLMGMISADVSVKGQSFDVKTMVAAIDGYISSAYVKGYRYHNIKLDGKIAAKQGDINFSSADSNLRVKLNAHADFNGAYPALKADINMDSIDFRALKLYTTELRARGIIHVDFAELNPDYPRGVFTWQKPVINADGRRYYLDSMYIVSRPSKDTGQHIFANLDVMQAVITGKTPLTKIGAIIQEHINRHYSFALNDSAKKDTVFAGKLASQKTKDTTKIPDDYNLQVYAHVIDKPMLHGLLPDLTSFDSIHVEGSVNPRSLTFKALIPDLVYSGTDIQNGVIQVNGADSAFTYKVNADEIKKSSIDLYFADIHGTLDQNAITANISLSDAGKKERFALAATMQKVGDSEIVHLQKGLKLNYKVWDVADQNQIVLANGGFYVRNFEISDSNEYIKANSDEARVNTPIKVDISNFLLSNITELASPPDTLLANGVVAGNFTIGRISPSVELAGNLEINNFSVRNDTLGNLKLDVANKDGNAFDTKLTLNGQGNDITMDGSYYLQTTNGNDFSFNLNVAALAVRSFETIAQNQIRNSAGYVRGSLKIQGTTDAPQITGELKTDNLVTTVSQLNAAFKMPSEKVDFTNSGISFDNFTVHDSADNKAVFNGSINTTDLSDIELDMKVSAKNWRALHSTVKDNKTFYGTLLLTTDLNIKGSPSAPSITGDLKILKGTNVTVVNPETAPEMQDTKGIVVFVNMRDTGRGNLLVPKAKTVVKHKMKAGSDMNVNITVAKEAQFSLIIDQASGDFLSVRGDATINAAVTPGGIISLSGSYDLHGGEYQLNYNFIKRKFSIKDGSTITFAGDPVNGTSLDIIAAYEAQVAPYDLIEKEVTDQTQLNYYKQQLAFEVDLNMKGKVMTPRLTFDVELPENKVYPLSAEQIETIQGKLNQVRTDTSELNKQVFAVLILGRFVSDDPFTSGAGGSTEFTAIQSVSTFIGEQLNQAAGKFVKGVDFSVDLAATEDYTTGTMQQRTDLNLAASKQLMNNRLKLTVGNDFELQGPQTSGNQSSVVPTNLAADYLLTEDGKYSMRAYRRVYDEGVLEGFVTETGLNFIVNLNFNNFNEVFMKKVKEVSDSTGK